MKPHAAHQIIRQSPPLQHPSPGVGVVCAEGGPFRLHERRGGFVCLDHRCAVSILINLDQNRFPQVMQQPRGEVHARVRWKILGDKLR